MSGYRSYVPWPKSSSSSSSYSSKKDVPTTSKYEPSYTSRSRSESKKVDDKPSSSLGSKYSAYGTGYQRDSNTSTSGLPTRTDLSRYKSDKKDSLHPPVSYRPITRTSTSRSRDPSPAERSKTESGSSSSGYNLNRLYPSSYSTRSVSRERTEPSSTTTIPKYTGRSSINKDDSKFSMGRTSRDVSREDLSSLATSSRYKTASSGVGSATSREDLSKPSQKYITSRFLPKNSVEKSYTAYTRTATGRASEASRKNRELLNVLSAQNDDKSSPSSRSSSTHEIIRDKPKELPKIDVLSYEDLETVSVVTRSTSPNPPSQTSVLRTRRLDNARLIEKQITRPKKRPEMIDKELQSDRLDDSTKTSRFAGASRIAAPWSSYLDLKYSSPNEEKQTKSNNSSQSDLKEDAPQRKGIDSPKPLSRNNSAKSLSHSSSKSDIPTKETKSKSTSSSSCDKPKSKLTPPRSLQNDAKKQLPPQIPKPETTTKSSSNSTPNKDFRKSILNMSSDAKAKKKSSKRSNSVSSADSDGANSEATEASENLSSCVVTFQRSSSISKLPQKSAHQDESRSCRSCTRSPSIPSDTSATTSGSEDDGKSRVVSKLKKFGSSSKTSSLVSAVEDLSDKSPKPPLSPRVKPDSARSEAEAKSFLMRALAPVTNFFKHKNDSSDKLNFLDSTCDNITEIKSDSSTSNLKSLSEQSQDTNMIPTKIEICRVQPNEDVFNFESECPDSKSNEIESSKSEQLLVPKILFRIESGERAWWLQDVTDGKKECSPGRNSRESTPSDSKRQNSSKLQIRSMKHADSGDIPWWLQENPSEIPEGVKVWPAASSTQDGVTEDGRCVYKVRNDGEKVFWFEETEESASSSKSGKLKIKVLRHVDSDENPWWLDENAEVPDGVQTYPNYKVPSCETLEEPEEKHKWLIGSNEDLADEGKLDEQSEPDFLRKYKIRHIDSGERAWWLNSVENIADNTTEEPPPKDLKKPYKITHQDSAEKPWWLESDIPKKEDEDSDNESNCDIPLGDRASPEGLETPREETTEGRLSPYDNVPSTFSQKKSTDVKLFICKHTNIDDILGGSGQLLSPLMNKIFSYQEGCEYDDEKCEEIDPDQVIIHEGTAQRGVIRPTRLDVIGGNPTPTPYTKLDDAALQLYKDGDYGSYLDLDASISEQQEEFDGFQSNKKNSIVLRTQLSVRVHTIIEKLLTSEGRELRRALFSLKQIFQEDKDLVHEFVQNDGLACLIKVGSEADQNYQNYILRALGQVMLYVDGMNGVMDHNQTIQWLYTLISSKFRLVVKTALKLLLVFVEYTDTNCMLLIKAIQSVDASQGLLPWHNIMKLLKDFDSADTELLIYATTLINKCLNGIPDQDTYYDQTDALEEQEIESIIRRYMSKPGTDLDLLQQFQIYEAVLQYEDGEDKGTPIRHLDENIRKTLRSRKSVVDSTERRKSRRHSTGNTPVHSALIKNTRNNLNQTNEEDDDGSSSSQSSDINNLNLNGSYKDSNKAIDAGVTPALRRRRERAERQRSFMKEQQENGCLLRNSITPTEDRLEKENGNCTNGLQQRLANGNLSNRICSKKDLTPLLNAVNKIESEENGLTKQPWILSRMYNKSNDEESQQITDEQIENANENDRNLLLQLKKENTVKDLTQKLSSQNVIHSPSEESKINRIGDMSGLISKAKEGLAKSKSQANVIKSPTIEGIPKVDTKKSENELRWEELAANLNRPLSLCDLDFRDLSSDDENDVLAPAAVQNGIPPPPPPLLGDMGSAPPPPPLNNRAPPPVPPVFGVSLQRPSKANESKIPLKKNKKTVKLFWKEVRDDPICAMKLKSGFIWDELNPVQVDTQKLEHLFESRAKDLINKKQQELNKNKEIIVLDPKRSNAINIGMTKLPQPRSIKTAILKMDATIMNREGIEKLLTMLPTEEERTKIQEAQAANPDLPLGSAEQFLLTLASISELPARLKLWAFKLDFENTEREIAEPLMDLKQGFEVLKINKTFRSILSTLLSIGNFLNGNEVKGFQIEYLSKVPEVKDTVHKHSLLHHLCHIVMEKFPDASDLYSEIGAITRASKVDFDELGLNIQRLEADCKASWDHLKLIAKHDGSNMMKIKMSDFLADCAERIILLGIIHRRVLNRFHKFLLWLGIPLHQISDTKPNEFCRIISEFSLEYRTTRERVLQQLEKKANHRERNKTRGKMITETGKFRTKEDRADAELRQLLGSDISDVESLQGTLTWRRPRKESSTLNRSFLSQVNGNITDGDDEILESLVKNATKGPTRTAPRERKRTRHADRKSLRRTLKNGLSEEEKKHLSTYIKGY